MDPREQVFSLRLAALNLAVVDISAQPQVGGQTVGSDCAARLDGLGDEPVQTGPGQIRDAAQTDSTNAFPIFLGSDDNQGFLLRPSANCACFLATPVRLVHFYDAIQSIATRANHRPTQFVQHRPSGLVAAQAQNTL